MKALDQTDVALLQLIQSNAQLTHQQLADKIGSSASSVWRRIQYLQQQGVIKNQVTLLDRATLGLDVCVLCQVKLSQQQTQQSFERFILGCDEVLECYALSGEFDYQLQVVVKDVEQYQLFLNNTLLTHASVASAASTFTLRQVKHNTAVKLC